MHYAIYQEPINIKKARKCFWGYDMNERIDGAQNFVSDFQLKKVHIKFPLSSSSLLSPHYFYGVYYNYFF